MSATYTVFGGGGAFKVPSFELVAVSADAAKALAPEVLAEASVGATAMLVEPGTNGEPGTKGEPGTNGDPGTNGEPGTKGDPGTNGEPGTNGSCTSALVVFTGVGLFGSGLIVAVPLTPFVTTDPPQPTGLSLSPTL